MTSAHPTERKMNLIEIVGPRVLTDLRLLRDLAAYDGELLTMFLAGMLLDELEGRGGAPELNATPDAAAPPLRTATHGTEVGSGGWI